LKKNEKALIRMHNKKEAKGKWIGHMLRGDSLLRTAIEGEMEGKKTRG